MGKILEVIVPFIIQLALGITVMNWLFGEDGKKE